MAALLKPQPAYDIVKGIKEACGEEVRVHVHVHATTGVTLVSLMKAIEAGADCVDTAISSLSLGPGHNPTESLVEMLEGTGFTTKLDKERLLKIEELLRQDPAALHGVRVQHHRRGDRDLRQPDSRRHDLQHGEPAQAAGRRRPHEGGAGGGAAASARTPAIPPLVTPSSQIVGTQAVFNVLMGRYKVLTGEFADLMLGYYGETIGPRDPARDRAGREAGQEAADHGRPADLLKPEWHELRDRRDGAARAATAPTRTC